MTEGTVFHTAMPAVVAEAIETDLVRIGLEYAGEPLRLDLRYSGKDTSKNRKTFCRRKLESKLSAQHRVGDAVNAA